MKSTYLILLTTELYFVIVECAFAPDINLEGRLIANNDSKILQLSCSTNIAVKLCTVEFLKDKSTFDNIRYFDNNCYHRMWTCSPTVCMCSGDCKSFTLNVTVTQDMMNYIYSCQSSMENKGIIYSASISVIQDGNGGSTIVRKIVVPSNIASQTQQATTVSPEITTIAFFSAPLIIVGASTLLSCVCFVIVLLFIYKKRCCNRKSEQKQNSSSIDDLGELAGFPQRRTRYNAPRKWKQPSSMQKCSEELDKVMYLGNEEKRLTISTISGSSHSLQDVIVLTSNISFRNNSSDA